MKTHQLINQDSGKFEYYTPVEIVDAAREVMRSIDLDPASSFAANKRVCASGFYDESMDGLSLPWYGSVWVNHPFSRKRNRLWVNKLLAEYGLYRVQQACCITFASTSERWFQPLAAHTQCYLSPRTNYFLPDGTKKKGVTKGSVVTYLGPHPERFADVFREFGVVKVAL